MHTVMEVMDISGLFEFFKGLWHDTAAVFFLGVVQEVDASQGELEAGVVCVDTCLHAEAVNLEMQVGMSEA
jgi:hypothetical protein